MVHIFRPLAAIMFLLCSVLAYMAKSKASTEMPVGFNSHLVKFLIAWVLCISGEWLCGPGVYALYASYGFTHAQTAQLFILGFVFSSILGLFAGRFADRFGRKRSAILFCGAGITACACRHVPLFWVMCLGRLFDGLHASLLYTAFESWVVSEHFQRHAFPSEFLGHTFSLMFSMSYLCAILCGLICQFGVWAVPQFSVGFVHFGRWVVPYELSAFVQLLGGIYIALNWNENYGLKPEAVSDAAPSSRSSLQKELMRPQVLICGLMVSCFESSMFIFVFSWTPAMAPNGDKSQLPAGLIFAVYMMACMSGASTYSLISKRFAGRVKTSTILFAISTLAACAMLVPSFCTISEETIALNFMGFVLFEFCVGAYFPAAGAMKSELVGETHRTTIYNLFRTPMNCIVVAVLLCTPSTTVVFRLLCVMLFTVAACLGAFGVWDRRMVKGDPLLTA